MIAVYNEYLSISLNPFLQSVNQNNVLIKKHNKNTQMNADIVSNNLKFNIGMIDANDLLCHPLNFQPEEKKTTNNDIYIRFLNLFVELFENISIFFADNTPVFVLKG